MAYITVNGLEEYEIKISKLAKKSEGLCKIAIYPAAGYMTDKIRDAVSELPIEEGKNGMPPFAFKGKKITGISKIQKKDISESLGIAHMKEKAGYIYAKIGWDGYGSIKTKAWPKGVPNILLVRTIESGTRFRKKRPFIRKTIKANEAETIRRMAIKIDEILEKEFK